jgi:hypothetical protein
LRITGDSNKRDEGFTSKVSSLLQGLPLLEKLDIAHCNGLDSLFLTPNLTSLTFGIVLDQRTLEGVGCLPLMHFGITIGCANLSNLEWMSAASWFNTLSSLSISGYYIKLDWTAEVLPPNLERLTVGNYDGCQTDLGALVSTQSSLRSLTAGCGWSIKSPLPNTLTDLTIARLIVELGSTMKEVARFIPPSVTSLFIPNAHILLNNQASTPVLQEDAIDFAVQIIPQLSAVSAAGVARQYAGLYIVREEMTAENSARLGAAISTRLRGDGYAELHFYWMVKLLMTTGDIGDHVLANAFAIGLDSKKDVALFLESKRRGTSSLCKCTDHYASSLKCLDWGLTRHLTLTNFTPPPLSECALLNLRKIEIVATDLTGMDQFFTKYTFHCVKTIVVRGKIETDDDICRTHGVIQALHSNRARLPRLQKVSFPGLPYCGVDLPTRTECLLGEMRLRRGRNSYRFRYTVALPPSPVPISSNPE